MWYGEEKSSFSKVGLSILLALIHFIVMPVLMINTTATPLNWLYQKYNLPFMKAFIQMLGYLACLILYSYKLLFDFTSFKNIYYYTHVAIDGWMISLWVNEVKQAFVSAKRKRFKRYICNVWNLLDWAVMIVYASGMSFIFVTDEDPSSVLFVLTFILLSIRILKMFSISEYLGPKLVIIKKMFKDTFVFLIILTVIMMSYNVSYQSLNYPFTEFSLKEIEKIMQHGFWILFGENDLDETNCTEYQYYYTNHVSGEKERCPAELGKDITPYLKALYGLIAVILLLNLLIAIYSNTYQKVNDECKFHWAQLQTDFLEEYSLETIFPIHLQLLVLLFCLVHFTIWCAKYCCFKIRDPRMNKIQNGDHHDSSSSNESERDKLKKNPMFVRVFLYNEDHDLKLKSTEKAERIGAVRSKGKIEITEEDKITKLQNQMDRKFEDQQTRNDEMLKMIKEIMKINHKNLKETRSMNTKLFDRL